MTTLYLIAHKVHGKVAFDVAMRFDEVPDRYDNEGKVRPYMHVFDTLPDDFAIMNGDAEEDPPPYWIIPTSGRRAYPFQHTELEWDELSVGEMPAKLPDHYPPPIIPVTPKLDLTGLIKPAPESAPIRRRA